MKRRNNYTTKFYDTMEHAYNDIRRLEAAPWNYKKVEMDIIDHWQIDRLVYLIKVVFDVGIDEEEEL